jgi:hypothetical protein
VAVATAGALLGLGAVSARAETVDRKTAREEAGRILAERRFHPRPPPRPFRGILRRLGEALAAPVRAVLRPLGRLVPAFGTLPWHVLALLVVTGAGVVAYRLAQARSRPRFLGPGRGGRAAMSPEELEAEAERAEARGELEVALRLRFRAGLLRLDRLGAVPGRPGLTNAAVARTLRSRTFDALAWDFDEVVYGGRPATAGDLEEARDSWPRVLEEARPR